MQSGPESDEHRGANEPYLLSRIPAFALATWHKEVTHEVKLLSCLSLVSNGGQSGKVEAHYNLP